MNPTRCVLVASLCLTSNLGLAGEEKFELLPSDGASQDQFGHAVDVDGATAIVGSLYADPLGTSAGAAYLFDTVTGQQLDQLLASDGTDFDLFGCSVAIHGTTAIVGAHQDDDKGDSSGAAYVFDTTTGQQVAKLLPADGEALDHFGFSVAIDGTTAVVGADWDEIGYYRTGSAYVFSLVGGQWLEVAKLAASDGESGDHFGHSVAISGNTIVVGAPFSDHDQETNCGAAYVFDAVSGQQVGKLVPTQRATGDEFGDSVGVSGNLAVVGAHEDEREEDGDGSNDDHGAAYLFDTTTGQQLARLLPADPAKADHFGIAVAISGSTVVIGSNQDDDDGTSSGSVYLFDATTGVQKEKFRASDGASHDELGWSVAVDGSTIVAGARKDDDPGLSGYDHGSAYVFTTCRVEFETFGVGLEGSGAFVPTLDGFDDSCDKAGHSIEIRDGLGKGRGFLWVGSEQADIPFFGGNFYIDLSSWWFKFPIRLNGPKDVPGAGWLVLPGGDVNGLEGLTFYLQATMLDPGAIRGVSLTNGLGVHVLDLGE